MEPVKVIHVATAGNYVLIKYNEKAISHANFTVAIYSGTDKQWIRAVVLSLNMERRECHVRYTEIGCTDTVTLLATHPVPLDIAVEKVPAQTIDITLCDVFPIEQNISGKYVQMLRWPKESVSHIREKYHLNGSSHMYEHKYTIQGQHFGKLFVKTSRKLLSLGKQLVDCHRAMFSDQWLSQVCSMRPDMIAELTRANSMFPKIIILETYRRKQRKKQRSRSVAHSEHTDFIISDTTSQHMSREKTSHDSGDRQSRRSKSLIRPETHEYEPRPKDKVEQIQVETDTGLRPKKRNSILSKLLNNAKASDHVLSNSIITNDRISNNANMNTIVTKRTPFVPYNITRTKENSPPCSYVDESSNFPVENGDRTRGISAEKLLHKVLSSSNSTKSSVVNKTCVINAKAPCSDVNSNEKSVLPGANPSVPTKRLSRRELMEKILNRKRQSVTPESPSVPVSEVETVLSCDAERNESQNKMQSDNKGKGSHNKIQSDNEGNGSQNKTYSYKSNESQNKTRIDSEGHGSQNKIQSENEGNGSRSKTESDQDNISQVSFNLSHSSSDDRKFIDSYYGAKKSCLRSESVSTKSVRDLLELSPDQSAVSSQDSTLPTPALPKPDEPYLKLCNPVVHSKIVPHIDASIYLGALENRLHHSITDNPDFPRVSIAQVGSVSAILEHRNMCIVHTLKSQYNSAYLGSLISVLIEKKFSYRNKKSVEIEPFVVILAPNSKVCDELYRAASCFIDKYYDVTVKTIYGSSPENERKAWLRAVNGCDILITTPLCLGRLQETRKVGLSNVFHYVLERADILLDRFSKEVMSYLGFLQALSKARIEQCPSSPELQVILSSEVYNKKLENLIVNKMSKPVLVFSSFLEAAIYGKVEFSLSIITGHEKKQGHLLKILQTYSSSNEKIAILCENSSQVLQVESFLSSLYPNLFPIHSALNIVTVHSYMTKWNLGKHNPILICDDEAMCNVFVEDVSVLVHYALPSNKNAFPHRFKLLKSALVNMFEHQADQQVKCGRCHVLLSDSNVAQFHDIVSLCKRIRLDIPSHIVELSKQTKHRREAEKRTVPLCIQLLMFGQCHVTACKYRHAFVQDLDSPASHLPRQGMIKFNVLSVIDGSCFTIRLLEKYENGAWVPHHDKLTSINMAMRAHFADTAHRVVHCDPSLGDVVGVERAHGRVVRARVMEIVSVDEAGAVNSVRVKLCDAAGKFDVYPVSKLYSVPPNLKIYPDQVLLAFATKLLPMDQDEQWNPEIGRYIESLIDQNMRGEHEKYFVGKIVLALNSAYFLDSFQCSEYLPSSQVEISHFQLRTTLLSTQRAIPNPSHMESLYEQCGCLDGAIPSYVKELTQERVPVLASIELPTPKWAHLDQDEMNDCTLVGIVNPSLFFLRLNQFQDMLMKLNKEIGVDVSKTSSRYSKEQCHPGLLCLARSDDKSGYNRVQVTDTSDPELAMILFVDYSDKQEIPYEDLVPIHRPQLISNLPFQAIECYLAGVEPLEGVWSQAAYDFLDDFTRLFARVVSVKLHGEETGGRRYAVELFDLDEELNINKELVALDLAKFSEDANVCLSEDDATIFKEIEKLMQNSESEDGEEVWEDLPDKSNHVIEKQAINFDQQDEEYVIDEAALLDEEEMTEFVSHLYGIDLAPRLDQKLTNTSAPSSSRPLPSLPETSNETIQCAGISTRASNPEPSLPTVKLTPFPEDIDPDMPPLTLVSYPAKTMWYQSQGFVFIQFHLPGLHDKYTLNIEHKFVHFYVSIDDRQYENQLPLLCSVVPELSRVEYNGFEMRLRLQKQMASLEWPCLLEDGVDREIRWLVYNVDHLDQEENEDSRLKSKEDQHSSEDEVMKSCEPEDNVLSSVPEDI
ncbi:hypothetical protein M8J75_006618 [Diaphorina citri]|nr:hypothetical protein M8J75_006618 [Diaphorina citri]